MPRPRYGGESRRSGASSGSGRSAAISTTLAQRLDERELELAAREAECRRVEEHAAVERKRIELRQSRVRGGGDDAGRHGSASWTSARPPWSSATRCTRSTRISAPSASSSASARLPEREQRVEAREREVSRLRQPRPARAPAPRDGAAGIRRVVAARAPSGYNTVRMFRNAGPRVTRNIAGKMNTTVGKSILIGAFIARSSAAD